LQHPLGIDRELFLGLNTVGQKHRGLVNQGHMPVAGPRRAIGYVHGSNRVRVPDLAQELENGSEVGGFQKEFHRSPIRSEPTTHESTRNAMTMMNATRKLGIA